MRTTRDRIRYAISFEIIGLLLVIPLGSLALHRPLGDIGVVAAGSATLATLWNYAYNIRFDRGLLWLRGSVRKTIALRVLHAVLFEVGLLIVLMPLIAWYLGIGLWEALLLDLSFALFYMAYAFVFGWAYDRAFPLRPAPKSRASHA